MGAELTEGRIAGLDELRGLAISAVVLSHIGWVFHDDLTLARVLALPALGVGVDLFFVISGFVIVANARRLRSAAGNGFWRGAAAFWMRRLMRIAAPAWVVVACLGGFEALGKGLGATLGDLSAATGFYANFHWGRCFEGNNGCGQALASSHFWSLASEMQFYAIAPFVAALRLMQARVLGFFLLTAGAIVDRPWGGFLWTFRPDGLIVGTLLALELASPRCWLRRLPGFRAGTAAFWIVVAATLARTLNSGAGLVIIAVIFGMVAAANVAQRDLRAVPSLGPLKALGALSFSIYLVHLPTLFAVRKLLQAVAGPEFTLVAAIVATVAVALALERWVAAPAMVAGRRLSDKICQIGVRDMGLDSKAT